VFTARYALSPYIKQIRFVFKGLIHEVSLRDAQVGVWCAMGATRIVGLSQS
jgi:hypothetical protein